MNDLSDQSDWLGWSGKSFLPPVWFMVLGRSAERISYNISSQTLIKSVSFPSQTAYILPISSEINLDLFIHFPGVPCH